MSSKPSKPIEPYFAPSAPAPRSFGDTTPETAGLVVPRVHSGEAPAWGEDAEQIAREAGLGSYGAEGAEQEHREEVLLRTLEAVRGEFAGLRAIVLVLIALVFVLFVAVAWLWLRTAAS